jgi:hypothetical protein
MNLNDARKIGERKGIVNGFGMGAVYFVLFGAYALAFWYGSTLVLTADYSPGSMMIVSNNIVNIYEYGDVINLKVNKFLRERMTIYRGL